MPGLIAFKRRWGIGSDDFVFPALLELFLRLVWITAISIVYSVHSDAIFECKDGRLLKAYYIGVLVLLSMTALLCASIVYVSMQGTIMITSPRKKLSKLLYLKIIITIPEIVWNILGTYWSFLQSSNCQEFVVRTVQGAVITGWVLGVIVIIGIAIVFDPLGKVHKKHDSSCSDLQSDEKSQILEGAMTAAKQAWEKRCRLLCCCILGDEQSKDAFDEISNLLADFFQDLDLVPTDIAAGLILVQKDQEKISAGSGRSYNTFTELSTSVKQPVSSPSDVPLGPAPWMTSKNMHHYMNYAVGSYGWPMFMFSHLATGLCRLCGACRCQLCSTGGEVIDDNCCQCHTAAIRRQTRISDTDLVYVSFHNKIYQIPFYVALDRSQQTVVVSVRGTLSLKDAVTDMSAESDPLEMVENAKGHRGILQAAKYIKDQLLGRGILEAAFQQAQGAGLVICGHSLGAGAAALLALLLKSEYPDVRCFAYSPPCGLMRKEWAVRNGQARHLGCCRDIYSELQSRPNLVDGCITLRVGSPPRGSQCVGEMDGDRTVITYKSVGTQCSGKCTSSLQGLCQTQASFTEDRQFNSSVLHQSPRGTKSAVLCVMTWRILHWCYLFGIQLKAAHIPGKRNVIPDQLSRGRQIPKMTEWSLNQEIVQQIFRAFPTPNIDLFATRENRKLTVFCPSFPDPLAWECDALAVD